MPITYTIDRQKGHIYETWTGDVRIGEVATLWKEYLGSPEVMKVRRTLADVRTCNARFTGAEFEFLIKDLLVPAMRDAKWTTAIVVARPDQFGLGRQYQVFAQHYSRDAIFHDPADAEMWLAAHGASP